MSVFLQIRKQLRNSEGATNEAEYNKYLLILNKVHRGEPYRKAAFYGGDSKAFEQYSKMEFEKFIVKALSIRRVWYRNMKHIFSQVQGRQRFLKHGYEFMKVVANKTKRTQTKIIELQETKDAPVAVGQLLNELYKSGVVKKPDKLKQKNKECKRCPLLEAEVIRLRKVITSIAAGEDISSISDLLNVDLNILQ